VKNLCYKNLKLLNYRKLNKMNDVQNKTTCSLSTDRTEIERKINTKMELIL
jgi:hypothetical protein